MSELSTRRFICGACTRTGILRRSPPIQSRQYNTLLQIRRYGRFTDSCRYTTTTTSPRQRSIHPQRRRSYASASDSYGSLGGEDQNLEMYDVVCVGGGPAGLSLLTALPMGAWSHLQLSRVQPYNEMQVWDGVSGSRISFDWPSATGLTSQSSSSEETIAYMTENLNLTSGLLKRLDELGGVSFLDNSRVENIGYGPTTDLLDLSGWPVVEIGDGRRLAARLLVGADGANSPVRKFAGIESRGWDYDRHALVATVQLEGNGWGGEGQKTAYQRFLPTGPVALLPMPGNFSTLVWSTLPSHAALLKSLSTTDLIAMINAAFRLSPVDLDYLHAQSTGHAEEVQWREQHTKYEERFIPQRIIGVQEGTVASFPLKMKHADGYIAERVALVGDAAHTVHPLAGQGLNQGQGDVQSLAKTIIEATSHGQDIG
ncbi:MAG: hypothetical protein M1823_001364 [Watsoniomyces obsoletus]|nr:MAG: hypothetical protein M1823_001364 [Watsoniomyces obsoletus]